MDIIRAHSTFHFAGDIQMLRQKLAAALEDCQLEIPRDGSILASGHYGDDGFCIIYKSNRFCGNISIRSLPSGGPLRRGAKIAERIAAVLLEVGLEPVVRPLMAELDYISHNFAADQNVRNLLEEVRIIQTDIERCVKEQRWADGKAAFEARDKLIDQLYALCSRRGGADP